MNEKKCIVTIINSISETSMPFNEFVLYRDKKYINEKQILIICDKPENTKQIDIPDQIETYYVENNLIEIRKIVLEIKKKCKVNRMKMIVHLHQPKSGLLFHSSMIFTDIKRSTIFTVHSMYELRNIKWKVMSILNVILSNKVTLVSESAYDSYPNFIKKIKNDKMLAIQNGVDTERINKIIKDTNVSKQDNYKNIVYVSRMIPIKNHLFILKVLSRLDGYRLILIGKEDENKEIRKFVNENNMKNRVEILGLIPRNQVFEILKKSDIYLSPSTVEGLPISVLEAMYTGIPVIISDIKPHKEIARYENEIQCIELKEDKWEKLLKQYLKKNRDELERIGETCRICAQENFSLEKMHLQYDLLYDQI